MAIGNDEIKVVIRGEDKASGVFSDVGGSLKKLGGVAGDVAKAVGVGLVAALGTATAFGVSAFKEFVEAEKQMTIATGILGKDLERVKGQMEETGKAAVKLGFDDEAASVAFAKLFKVTGDAAEAQREVKLAMDLASQSGRSLEEASQALVTVHAGGTKVLKEFGIEVKEGTTSLEALALIEQNVTGRAEEMANTTEGKLRQLEVSWGNLKESVGGALAEAISPFISKLTEWAQSDEAQVKIQEIVNQLAGLVKQLMPIIIDTLPLFVKGLGLVVTWVTKGIDILKGFNDWIVNVMTNVIIISDKIGAFIDRVEALYQSLKKLSVSGFLSSVGGAITAPIDKGMKKIGLPTFQDGGFVNAPTSMAVPAILHGGETVIPAGRGMGGIVVNVTGVFMDEDSAERVGDKIIDKLRLSLRI